MRPRGGSRRAAGGAGCGTDSYRRVNDVRNQVRRELIGTNSSVASTVGGCASSSMPHPPQNQKPTSRFSSLSVFRLKPGPPSPAAVDRTDAAPPPPPKDPSPFYNRSFFSRSAASLAPSLSPDSASPATPFPSACLEFGKRSNIPLASPNGRAAAASPVPSASGGSLRSQARAGGDFLAAPSMDGSTDSSGSCPNPNPGVYLLNGANSSSYPTTPGKPKKGVFRLAGLAKRNRSKKDLSDTASASGSVSRSTSVGDQDSALAKPDGDEGITMPWNFQVGTSSQWHRRRVSLCTSHSTTYMSTRGECHHFVFAHTCIPPSHIDSLFAFKQIYRSPPVMVCCPITSGL